MPLRHSISSDEVLSISPPSITIGPAVHVGNPEFVMEDTLDGAATSATSGGSSGTSRASFLGASLPSAAPTATPHERSAADLTAVPSADQSPLLATAEGGWMREGSTTLLTVGKGSRPGTSRPRDTPVPRLAMSPWSSRVDLPEASDRTPARSGAVHQQIPSAPLPAVPERSNEMSMADAPGFVDSMGSSLDGSFNRPVSVRRQDSLLPQRKVKIGTQPIDPAAAAGASGAEMDGAALSPLLSPEKSEQDAGQQHPHLPGSSSPRCYVIWMVSLFIITGVPVTLVNSWQNRVEFDTLPEYNHPFIQALTNTLGESVALPIFFISLWLRRRRGEDLVEGVDMAKPDFPKWNLLLLALNTTFTNVTLMTALSMSEPNIYAILKKSSTIFTFAISMVWLKKRYQPYQWLGLGMLTGAFILLFFAPNIEPSKKGGGKHQSLKNQMVGNSLTIVGAFLTGLFAVQVERLMKLYGVPPMQLIGCSSGIASILLFVVVAAMQPFKNRPDDASLWAQQFVHGWQIPVTTAIILSSASTYAYTTTVVTRLVSGTHRKVFAEARTVIVWVLALSIPLFRGQFRWTELGGQLVIIAAMLVFIRVIKLPCAIFGESFIAKEKVPGAVVEDELHDAVRKLPEDDRVPLVLANGVDLQADGDRRHRSTMIAAATLLRVIGRAPQAFCLLPSVQFSWRDRPKFKRGGLLPDTAFDRGLAEGKSPKRGAVTLHSLKEASVQATNPLAPP